MIVLLLNRLRMWEMAIVWTVLLLAVDVSHAASTNLLTNGGFETGAMNPWVAYGNVTAEVTDEVGTTPPAAPSEGAYSLHVTVDQVGVNPWDAGIVHARLVFEQGKEYLLRVSLMADRPMRVGLGAILGTDPWTTYGRGIFTVTEEWEEYYITVPPIPQDVDPAEVLFHVAYDVGELWIDNVSFRELTADENFHYSGPRYKGFSYASWLASEYSDLSADRALAHLADTGTEQISLIVTRYQDNIASTDIQPTISTATDEDLIHAITTAHALGLKVMLKPHVDPLNDAEHWRGDIGSAFQTETEWASWFDSYKASIYHYADLAEAQGIEQFSVGCELKGTTHREAEWRDIIAGVRSRYSGSITYAANHSGEETSIRWWDAVDYIGVDGYYQLTDKNDPTVSELKAAWLPHITTLRYLAIKWQRPILLTEIGYRSLDGANRVPSDWHRDTWNRESVDLQEQADCYQAAFESLYEQPWLAGIFWWAWSPDEFQGGVCDNDYTPSGKPAEDVLRQWYGAPPREIIPPPRQLPQYDQTLDIYTDGLGEGWGNWSWNSQIDLNATGSPPQSSPVISVRLDAWGSLALGHAAFDSSPYEWLEFYVRGAPTGQQNIWASFYDPDGTELRRRPVDDCLYIEDGIINDSWKRARIPLSHLDAADRMLKMLVLRDRRGQAVTEFSVDDIRLVPALELPDYGDINGDGALTPDDARQVLQHVVHLIHLTGQQAEVADVNGSGSITAQDAALILMKIAGRIDKFRSVSSRR